MKSVKLKPVVIVNLKKKKYNKKIVLADDLESRVHSKDLRLNNAKVLC